MSKTIETKRCDTGSHNDSGVTPKRDILSHFQYRHHLTMITIFSNVVTEIMDSDHLTESRKMDMMAGIARLREEFITVLSDDNAGFNEQMFRNGCMLIDYTT